MVCLEFRRSLLIFLEILLESLVHYFPVGIFQRPRLSAHYSRPRFGKRERASVLCIFSADQSVALQ